MGSASYFQSIGTALHTLRVGLGLTWKHLLQSRHRVRQHNIAAPDYFADQHGITTVAFPHERIPVPDNGRYKLHNEIDDCIVCDKCVKVCPVNCITIEPIRSAEEFGKTSDGTPRRIYAARFDIDMGKCCFCGLCTTVCPTECLTMTSEYNFSTYDIRTHLIPFANMSPAEIADRKAAWESHQAAKQASAPSPPTTAGTPPPAATGGKPVFRPKLKPAPPQSPKPDTE